MDHEEKHNDWYDQVSKEWNFESFITDKAQDSPEYKDEEYENQWTCWHDEQFCKHEWKVQVLGFEKAVNTYHLSWKTIYDFEWSECTLKRSWPFDIKS